MQMDRDRKTQRRYEGFMNTPNLWNDDVVKGIHQFELSKSSNKFTSDILDNLRLGKYIEQFVFYVLQQDKNIRQLKENIQIQKGKQTLGEIDCLFLENDQPIHLEISYKFYVVDFSRGTNEVEHCIGPNNRDSLVEKLTRIKDHQLPLLFREETQEYLDALNFNIKNCTQQVLFKCQLYLPLSHLDHQFENLNQDCVAGIYLRNNELDKFSSCKYFIPDKKDWLINPIVDVDWLNFKEVKKEIKRFHEKKYSPLCWMKHPNGEIVKAFVIWW